MIFICGDRWIKLQLVGWAATCLSSEVGTLTSQPLGINSGQDLGAVSGNKSLNHLISSDDGKLADRANHSLSKI